MSRTAGHDPQSAGPVSRCYETCGEDWPGITGHCPSPSQEKAGFVQQKRHALLGCRCTEMSRSPEPDKNGPLAQPFTTARLLEAIRCRLSFGAGPSNGCGLRLHPQLLFACFGQKSRDRSRPGTGALASWPQALTRSARCSTHGGEAVYFSLMGGLSASVESYEESAPKSPSLQKVPEVPLNDLSRNKQLIPSYNKHAKEP